MPKSTKKQKDKSTDFKKAKLKLGKGKKPATNAVDTSFKAHSIALPVQSISENKPEAGPSTRRRHNLSELISLTRHYSANSRKDALSGLRELFSSHTELALTSASIVIPACCKMIADEDASVRKALADFLDWYLHALPRASISPYAPTLLLFTTSAQSHIFPEIRVDAIHILNVLLDVVPAEVTSKGTSGHGSRVLQGYCNLLVGGSSKNETDAVNISATTLSTQSKQLVISSLERFLDVSTQFKGSEDEFWYLKQSFTSSHAHQAFIGLLKQPTVGQEMEECYSNQSSSINQGRCFAVEQDHKVLTIDPWQEVEMWDAFEGCFASASRVSSVLEESYAEKAEKLLCKYLIEVWLDNVPNAFLNLENPNSKFAELRLVHAVAKLAQTIYHSILQAPSEDNTSPGEAVLHLDALLSYMSIYLPLARNTPTKVEFQAEDLIRQMDLIFCETFSLVLLHKSSSQADSTSMQKSRPKLHSMVNTHMSKVSLWIEDILRLNPTANHPMGQSLSESTARAICPVIWAIISYPNLNQDGYLVQTRLLETLADQIRSGKLADKPKAVLIQFIITLNLLQREPEYTGIFRIQAVVPASASLVKLSQATRSKTKLIEETILQLPKILWELGTSNPGISQFMLFLLLRCVQRVAMDWEPSTTTQITQRFSPFFAVEHPNLGTLYGPFNKFPSTTQGIACQKLALDLAYSLSLFLKSRLDKNSLASSIHGLRQSVDKAIHGTRHEIYWKRLTSQ
ncbi:hypothetical protein M408DRAFT_60449 [Serendipita vermifera MAFF 305830]|uniref:Pre-rRNA-processing protein n=1 Tax=Serendipita vermifera MAFF 305830 TaxID=933852 RepID=A0A0C3BQ47_SERVB|nr:hypothetical protein M408DRAFT_60449 [Serendipita vermifera MAFF 305830]